MKHNNPIKSPNTISNKSIVIPDPASRPTELQYRSEFNRKNQKQKLKVQVQSKEEWEIGCKRSDYGVKSLSFET